MAMGKRPDANGIREKVTQEEIEQIEAEIEADIVYSTIAELHNMTHKQIQVIARKRRERLGIPSTYWMFTKARSMDDVLMEIRKETVGSLIKESVDKK